MKFTIYQSEQDVMPIQILVEVTSHHDILRLMTSIIEAGTKFSIIVHKLKSYRFMKQNATFFSRFFLEDKYLDNFFPPMTIVSSSSSISDV